MHAFIHNTLFSASVLKFMILFICICINREIQIVSNFFVSAQNKLYMTIKMLNFPVSVTLDSLI